MLSVILLSISVICGVSSQWREKFDHYYRVYDWPATFAEAENQCRYSGAHLASIHSEAENNFIHGLTTKRRRQKSHRDFVWIGLMQADWPDSETWSWTDGTPVDYLKWSTKQPDNLGGNEHCVQFYSDKGRDLKNVKEKRWNDVDCKTTLAKFVCKKSKYSVLQRWNPRQLYYGPGQWNRGPAYYDLAKYNPRMMGRGIHIYYY